MRLSTLEKGRESQRRQQAQHKADKEAREARKTAALASRPDRKPSGLAKLAAYEEGGEKHQAGGGGGGGGGGKYKASRGNGQRPRLNLARKGQAPPKPQGPDLGASAFPSLGLGAPAPVPTFEPPADYKPTAGVGWDGGKVTEHAAPKRVADTAHVAAGPPKEGGRGFGGQWRARSSNLPGGVVCHPWLLPDGIERRVDPSDGNAYDFPSFNLVYGEGAGVGVQNALELWAQAGEMMHAARAAEHTPVVIKLEG